MFRGFRVVRGSALRYIFFGLSYNVRLANRPVYPTFQVHAQTRVCVKVNNYKLSGLRGSVAREPTYALPQTRTSRESIRSITKSQ